jgi:hypothetical protein
MSPESTRRVWTVVLLAAAAMLGLGAWLGASRVHADAGVVGQVDCGSPFSPTNVFQDDCSSTLGQRKPAAIGLLALGGLAAVGGVAAGAKRETL